MAGVRKQKLKNGKYQGWFMAIVDGKKKRVYRTGTHDKRETLSIMQKLEDDHRQISLGYREPPKPCERYRDTPLADITAEYIAFGKAQGGRNGYPWNKLHANQNITLLQRFWPTELGISLLGEMNGILSGVEKSIRMMLEDEQSGKSIKNKIAILNAFCNWCVKHDYLADNPLKKLKPIKTEATFKRRAITFEELERIVNIITANPEIFGHWPVLLAVACFTGIRRNALRNLTIDDLDVNKCQLHLKASSAKNRKESYKAISEKLAVMLKRNYDSGEPKRLHDRWYNHKSYDELPPKNALLYVPTKAAKELAKILELAGIEQENKEGRIDFHALRQAYATFVIESGANPKQAQVALDHSDPRITFNTYAQVRQDGMRELAEKVTEPVMGLFERAKCVHQKETADSNKNYKPCENSDLQSIVNGAGDGIRNFRHCLRFENTTHCQYVCYRNSGLIAYTLGACYVLYGCFHLKSSYQASQQAYAVFQGGTWHKHAS